MNRFFTYVRYSLVSKRIIIVGLTVILFISAWAYVDTNTPKTQNLKNITAGTDRLSNSIKLGTLDVVVSLDEAVLKQVKKENTDTWGLHRKRMGCASGSGARAASWWSPCPERGAPLPSVLLCLQIRDSLYSL